MVLEAPWVVKSEYYVRIHIRKCIKLTFFKVKHVLICKKNLLPRILIFLNPKKLDFWIFFGFGFGFFWIFGFFLGLDFGFFRIFGFGFGFWVSHPNPSKNPIFFGFEPLSLDENFNTVKLIKMLELIQFNRTNSIS